MEGEDEALRFSGVKLLIGGQVAESRFLIQWEKGKRMHRDVETHTSSHFHTLSVHLCFLFSVWLHEISWETFKD